MIKIIKESNEDLNEKIIKINKNIISFDLKKKNNKNKKFVNHFRNTNYLVLIILIYLNIISSFTKNIQRLIDFQISGISKIELKFISSGYNQIYHIKGDQSSAPLPEEVRLNGVKQDIIETSYLMDEGDIITLVWNSNITTTKYMFYECIEITEIDFSKFDTSLVTRMESMFYGCESLTSLNLSNFNTENVEDMNSLFFNCLSLTSLNLSSFNTSKVKYMNSMFYNCSKLNSLDLSNFNTECVESMNSMFFNCSSLITLNLSNFNTSKVKNTCSMFYNCSQLISLELSNFNTENVEDMITMFFNCSLLTSLNLSNFNTSKVKYMNLMFSKCSSFISLDLSNFNTEYVENMDSMFFNCSSLITLNLSNFNTSKVKNMNSMFYGCSKLNSLDLSNFNTLKLESMENIFSYCSSLEYINLENSNLKFYTYSKEFEGINENIIIYSKDDKWNGVLDGYEVYINCKNYSKYKCFKKDLNKPYYENICILCGNHYYKIDDDSSNNNSFINCYKLAKNFDKDNNNYTNDSLKDNNEKEESITNKKIFANNSALFNVNSNDISQINTKIETSEKDYDTNGNIDNTQTNYSSKEEFILNENYTNNLIKTINISYIDNGNDAEIKKRNILYTITNTNNQKIDKNNNKTTIYLGYCENKLKKFYNISYNNSLYLIKVDIKEEGMNIPKVEYEVYYPLYDDEELIKLNLEQCKGMKVDISIPAYINDSIDIHNKSSDYYNNICSKTTSDSGTDISLLDRKKNFIDKNLTLCEEDCELINYNYTIKKAKCSCLTKIKIPFSKEIKINKTKLYNSFIDIKNFANINFMKCIKSVMILDSLKGNYGFFIYILIFIIFFITLFLFIFKYYVSLIELINQIFFAKIEAHNFKKTSSNRILPIKRKQSNRKKINKREKKSKTIKFLNNDNNTILPIKEGTKNFNRNLNKNITMNFSELSIDKSKKKNINKIIERTINQRILNTNGSNNISNNNNIYNNNDKYNELLRYNDFELNSLDYKNAIMYDNRSYSEFYLSLLRTKNLLFFSFYCNNNDYNSQIIKIFLFFFFFSVHFTTNALFFNDDAMHEIYVDKGAYNFIYQIPQIIYSSLISGIINIAIKYLSLTEKFIIQLKQEKNNFKGNEKELIKIIKIKFIIFFVTAFCLLILFAFYIICFCGIYENTQIHLIKDSFISFAISLINPFLTCLIPGLFRIHSLRNNKRNKQYLYEFSQIIQSVI